MHAYNWPVGSRTQNHLIESDASPLLRIFTEMENLFLLTKISLLAKIMRIKSPIYFKQQYYDMMLDFN